MCPTVLPLVNILDPVYFQRNFRTVIGHGCMISKLWAIRCVSVIFVIPFGWNLIQKILNEVSFEVHSPIILFFIVVNRSHLFLFFWFFSHFFFSQDWNRFYGEELYDHSIDPDEYMNLYDRYEFVAIKLQLKHILRSKLDN